MKKRIGEIIRNATVIYTDNTSEHLEALRFNKRGTVIGRIVNRRFIVCGYIPKKNIKEIRQDLKQ